MNDLNPAADASVIFLIRHGATDANLARPYILQGSGINLPLSAIGREQLTATAQKLANIPLDGIFCSPLLRAQESAQIVAQPHHLTPELIPEITEINVGEWEGLSWDKIQVRDPEAYAQFQADSAQTPYKGGENYSDVATRVWPVFQKLAATQVGKRVAIVAHNIVNRVILAHALGVPLAHAKDIRQANGCINVLRWQDGRVHLVTLNSIFHLPKLDLV
jgi:broad specificity phosphatase PhoE